MTTLLEEPILLTAPEYEPPDEVNDETAWIANHSLVLTANREASEVDAESLQAFLELLYAADPEYIDAPAAPEPAPLMNWAEVGDALAEAQAMLRTMQNLLSLTLEEMGIPDHDEIRVGEGSDGALRLISDHPRRDEIEAVINSPAHRQLQELFRAAANGMSLAGSLIGNGALPPEVLDMARSRVGAA